MLGIVLRVLAAAAVLLVIQGLAAGLTNALLGPSGVALPPGSLGGVVLSNLVTAAALAWLAKRSRLAGLRLAGWLALLFFGIAMFNNMIEALFFHVFGARDFARYLLQGALTAIPFSLVLVALMGRMRGVSSATTPVASTGGAGSWAWRLVAADLLYLACYLGAGNLIYPWVREFYESRNLPAQASIAAMQLLFRGPIFIALTLLILRMIDGDRWEKAVVAGAMLSLVGGVAPLLIPNPYLPDVVRWAHFFEVGISNFSYGAAIAWLLAPPLRPVAALAGSSA
jgi:hypothetical protein